MCMDRAQRSTTNPTLLELESKDQRKVLGKDRLHYDYM